MVTTIPYNRTDPGGSTYNFTRFLVLQTSVTLFTIVSAYIAIALCFFECMLSSKNQLQSQRSWMKQKGRYARVMRYESIVAALFLLGRLLCEQYELLAHYLGVTNDYCNVVVKVKVTLSSISVWNVYLFLWTRQRLCYSEPVMHHLSSHFMKAMSWISLLLLAVAQITSTILFVVTRFYKLTHLGCRKYMSTTSDKVPWIFIGAMTVCFQIIFLFLFIFPLIKHKAAIKSTPKVGSHIVLRLIKRAAFMTSVCIVTDLVSLLVILFASDKNEIVMILAYDVSLLTNIICVVASFSDWKLRFFAPIYCYKNATRHSIPVSCYARSETARSREIFALTSPKQIYSLTNLLQTNFANSLCKTYSVSPVNDPIPES